MGKKATAENAEALDALVADLEKYIREALDILESGAYVELNGLEEKVTRICLDVGRMPIGEAGDFRPKLSAVTKQLDLLQSIMTDHKRKIEDQLQGLDVQKRASVAYAKSDAMIAAKRPAETE